MASHSLTQLLDLTVQEMVKNGWKKSDRHPAVFTRTYQGCNHEHEATTTMFGFEGAYVGVTLMGSYQSEGRNILASCLTVIRDNPARQNVTHSVKCYTDHAEKLINGSYSVNLYRKFGMFPDCRRIHEDPV
ncbi:hypothetical protein [Nevskia ramosa]|uniref:hypothetical protein n=1 Tax=Nevskia ramosa TaxID=64002 RepID=UPI0023532486|nr:hypothetical protein [Nevskia ramosa]